MEKRLQAIQYPDYERMGHLCTDIRIVLRRVFGEQHVYSRDFELIRFRPDGLIANKEHHLMTGAWEQGCRNSAELLRAMKTELTVFGENQTNDGDITISWLIKNMPWEAWTALGTLVVTAFTAGAALASTTFVKELLGR
jgi:hypothetical protein